MHRVISVTLLSVFISAPAHAQDSWSTYDWQSGNQYFNNADRQGVTTQGFNFQNGTNWRLRQNFDGTYSGTDANGNFFQGNNDTGFYMNSDGTTCFGKGYARVCN